MTIQGEKINRRYPAHHMPKLGTAPIAYVKTGFIILFKKRAHLSICALPLGAPEEAHFSYTLSSVASRTERRYISCYLALIYIKSSIRTADVHQMCLNNVKRSTVQRRC